MIGGRVEVKTEGYLGGRKGGAEAGEGGEDFRVLEMGF